MFWFFFLNTEKSNSLNNINIKKNSSLFFLNLKNYFYKNNFFFLLKYTKFFFKNFQITNCFFFFNIYNLVILNKIEKNLIFNSFNYLIFNLNNLKILINFYQKYKLVVNAKPGIILNKLELKEKKIKKTWKITKILIESSLNYLNFYNNLNNFIFLKNLNIYVFKILFLIKFLKKKFVFLNFLLKNKLNFKRIKSIKKKFKKNFMLYN